MKKIVLITTGQPATNPRIVKEADTLQKAGFDVWVLYCHVTAWAAEKDQQLLSTAKWHYRLIGGDDKKGRLWYSFTSLRQKINSFLSRYITQNFLSAERYQARAYDELLKAAIKIKADWYIGHNLGSIPIVVKAASKNNAKAGFDFEDYHRGESGSDVQYHLKRNVFLENKYIHSLYYFSASSDLILNRVLKDHPQFRGYVLTLLNCFPLSQQPAFELTGSNDTLQLFWFSQTVGLYRGLETLIEAMEILNNSNVHLTLAGKVADDFSAWIKQKGKKMQENIHFVGTVEPDVLPKLAAQFDIGMALELKEIENRDICLTNKIFTYLLAGNGVILSGTSAQTAFNNKYNIGEVFPCGDFTALAGIISAYYDKGKLNRQRLHNYELAENEMNWENESKKLLEVLQ